MRTIFTTLFSLGFGLALGCSSSSSSPGTTTDAGKDTNGGGDTSVGDTPGSDTPAGDTRHDGVSGDTNLPPDDSSTGACDPVAQTGCTAPDTKCTAVDDGTGKGTMPGCVAPTGTAATGASCTRDAQTPAGVGHDTCAAGGYCSGIGNLTSPPTRFCRKFCTDDTTCASTEKCSILIADPSGAGIDGICVPTCTIFGSDCTGGMNCSVLIADMDATHLYGTCRAVGTTAIGAACTNANDCVADTTCTDPTGGSATKCTPICDTTHTCPSGMTCTAAGGLPNKGGICQ